MKMVKSLLLGTAAGLVAVAGAQAADLPVKAKPVEYVKVCSLYGAGFYYMPGTDICIKVGGYVRAQAYFGAGNTGTDGIFESTSGINNRVLGSTDFLYRVRGVLTLDTRQQTEYGTLRTYALIGYQHDGPNNGGDNTTLGANALYATRGFIQIAGFTFGKAQSFYDLFSQPAVSYFSLPGGDTGDPGEMLMAYTAQFGNGFTGTVSLEDPRRMTIGNASSAALFGAFTSVGTLPTQAYGGTSWPDVVGVLRVDQAWGSAQLMGAIHQVDANYYGGTAAGAEATGHPSDKVGWVIGGGALIKADAISRGDLFSFQVNYTQGATRYIDFTPGGFGSPFMYNGTSLGTILYTDGLYTSAAGGSSIELTTAFGAIAAYDHVWNQKWKSDLYGGLVSMRYDGAAAAMLQGAFCTPNGITVASGTCNPNGDQWFIGSRTQFNINASTYLGVDVMYRKLDTSFAGVAAVPSPGAALPTTTSFASQDAWMGTFRVHRDFLP